MGHRNIKGKAFIHQWQGPLRAGEGGFPHLADRRATRKARDLGAAAADKTTAPHITPATLPGLGREAIRSKLGGGWSKPTLIQYLWVASP